MMVRMMLIGAVLWSCLASGVALGCPLGQARVTVGATAVEALAVPTIGFSVVEAVVPQAVWVAPSHGVVESCGASAVVVPSAVITTRQRALLRPRFAPLRASSRVTVRTRVW